MRPLKKLRLLACACAFPFSAASGADVNAYAYERAIREALAANDYTERAFFFALIIVAGVGAATMVIAVINLVVSFRNSKSLGDRFVEMLKAVSEIAQVPPEAGSSPPGPHSGLPDGSRAYLPYSDARNDDPGTRQAGQDADRSELAGLAVICRDIGSRIDEATGRKNNSKNVAELVFKLSREMGLPERESSLYFSVAMVYDIGFLSVDRTLLAAETLTEGEKYLIRNHARQGLSLLEFVPEGYRSLFSAGVLSHHENMDGTGYPDGVSGNAIPIVARLIRVAESFNALISKRNYRDIVDKETAFDELSKNAVLYDPGALAALERLL